MEAVEYSPEFNGTTSSDLEKRDTYFGVSTMTVPGRHLAKLIVLLCWHDAAVQFLLLWQSRIHVLRYQISGKTYFSTAYVAIMLTFSVYYNVKWLLLYS